MERASPRREIPHRQPALPAWQPCQPAAKATGWPAMRTMVICVATLGGGGLIHYVAVSLPLVPCLLDGVKYMDPADMKPPQDQPDSPPKTSRSGAQKRGFERTARAPRAPTLRTGQVGAEMRQRRANGRATEKAI